MAQHKSDVQQMNATFAKWLYTCSQYEYMQDKQIPEKLRSHLDKTEKGWVSL